MYRASLPLSFLNDAQPVLSIDSLVPPLSINLHALPVSLNSLSSLPPHSSPPPHPFVCFSLSSGSEFSSSSSSPSCLSPLGHSTRPGSTKLLLVRRGATVVGGGVDGKDKGREGRVEFPVDHCQASRSQYKYLNASPALLLALPLYPLALL